MGSANSVLADVSDEFFRAMLPDKRLLARVGYVMAALQARPDHSYPDAMVAAKHLKAFYRLASNPRVDHHELLRAHVLATVQRAWETGVVDPLVLHDTSVNKPARAKASEVGQINTGAAGYFMHTSLLVSSVEEAIPLGVLALETLHRAPGSSKGAMSGAQSAKMPCKESERWQRAVVESEYQLGPTVRPIHVADREADSYSFYDLLLARNSRFVIRSDDRQCLYQGVRTTVCGALAQQVTLVERQVELPHRDSSTTAPKSVRSERLARLAKLEISGCSVELLPAAYVKDPFADKLRVNVVYVRESAPPEGETPIDWLLTTSEPIDTPEQLLRIVDIYRRRWIIEEFFKALKTGCLLEERHLQERQALLLALVLFLPIACQLLWLRTGSRAQPDASADGMLNDVQLKVLEHFAPRKLPPTPTRRQLVWCMASLGGHIKSNGEPGWQVLSRAFKRLLELEQGWRAALQNSS